MKRIIVLNTCFLLLNALLFGQQTREDSTRKAMANQIKQYWFVLVKTGPNTNLESATKDSLFGKHLDNITKLYNDGILKVAGPFGKNDQQWRGLFIFDCASKEEATRIAQTDPAIAAGLLAAEITPWFTAPVGSFMKGRPEKIN